MDRKSIGETAIARVASNGDHFPLQEAVWAGEKGFGPKVYEWFTCSGDQYLRLFDSRDRDAKLHGVTVVVMEFLEYAFWKPSDRYTVAWPEPYRVHRRTCFKNDIGIREYITTESGNHAKWDDEEYETNGRTLLRRVGEMHRAGMIHGGLCARSVVCVGTTYFKFIHYGNSTIFPHAVSVDGAKIDLQAIKRMFPERLSSLLFVANTDCELNEAGLAAYGNQ